MDRPVSAASSTTASAAAPTHKRNASIKNAVPPAGPSTVRLFLTNLRILNLDLLADWPSITVASFSTQDARARVKCTEYALYQLFHLYDPATTADKLQPFFPPLEPLQSVNLRAAIYRCLNELKKSGALPKDTVFRKSMLDDCQGEKFWEACLSFSTVVVRRMTLDRKAKHVRPVAERLGTAQSLGKQSRDSMLPLAIAHKVALSQILEDKKRKRETYARLRDVLSDKGEELQERKKKSSQADRKIKTLTPERSRAIEDAIEKNWVGSVELKDALIGGDTCAQGDGILVEAFDQLWKQNHEQEIAVSNGADVGLLQSLTSRATQQSVRLRMWQNYLDRMVLTKPKSRSSNASSELQRPAVRFSRHRDINLKAPTLDSDDDDDDDEASPSPPPQRRHVRATSRYDEILTAMREELRKNSAQRSTSHPLPPPVISPLKRAQTQPVPLRRLSITPDASAGAQDAKPRSPSETAVPMRPRMGRRLSSQSKTYDKLKVESQREFIPLKAELFSPLKENRRSKLSFASAPPNLVTAVEEEEETDDVDDIVKQPRHAIGSRDDIDSGVDLQSINDARSSETNDGSSARSSTSVDDLTEEAPRANAGFKFPALPDKSTVRPSLAERTRMSIAFNNSDDIQGLLPDPNSISDTNPEQNKDEAMNLSDDTSPQPFTSNQISLLERTRQSISQAPPPQDLPASKKAGHARSRSSLHPVNQFETPRKTRSSTIGGGKRNATPMEQLMSPDAEYSSVFKSRPKIAFSPVLSARREVADGEGEDGDDGVDALDAVASSPLVR